MSKIHLKTGKGCFTYEAGTTLEAISRDFQEDYPHDIILARVDGKLAELNSCMDRDAEIEFITTGEAVGNEVYRRTASMMMLKAFQDVLGRDNFERLTVQYSLDRGYYCELVSDTAVTERLLDKVKTRMMEIQQAKMPIIKKSLPKREAIEMFREHKMYDKVNLFYYRRSSRVNIYMLGRWGDMMGADADAVDVRRDRLAAVQCQSPLRQEYGSPLGHRVGVVLAAGKPGGGLRNGFMEQLPQGERPLGLSLVQHADPPTVAEHLAPVVGDPQDGAGELLQSLRQFHFQLILQIAVQGREGFVQQDGFRFRRQDAGQGCPLLLTAGDLAGTLVRHLIQPELTKFFLCHGLPPLLVPHCRGDVLAHSHIGEQGILLEQVAYISLLGRQIDVCGAVEQGHAVQHDLAVIRRQDTGNAPQRDGLAAAGGA